MTQGQHPGAGDDYTPSFGQQTSDDASSAPAFNESNGVSRATVSLADDDSGVVRQDPWIVRIYEAGGTFAKSGARPLTHTAAAKSMKWIRQWHGDPYAAIEWELRDAEITGPGGQVVFRQEGCEFPAFWSLLASNVVANKYFRGTQGTSEREWSLRQLIDRVAGTIAEWGARDGYFEDSEAATNFYHDLRYLLVNQFFAFNSPVWFNLGVPDVPQQVSACFILGVEDSMESIMETAAAEARLFKGGSGAGSNRSNLRSSREHLRGGGRASGPVSFMRGYDAFAGVIQSGGRTRRAAKMEILNADHPDIREFIHAKPNEERKAWALIEQGYDPSFNGEAYGSVFFQNSNFSVRATDEFMLAALAGKPWPLRAVATHEASGVKRGDVLDTVPAAELLDGIAEGTHVCGDPGLQFHTTINRWNPVLDIEEVVASNPCSEFLHLNDTACNLASLNLMRFVDKSGKFLVNLFVQAVRTVITAMEIVVDPASYPTPRIAERSHELRPLGIGYANLGALLMSKGIPYDSDAGRAWAAAITSTLTATAYTASGRLAEMIGPFPAYEASRSSFCRVMGQHRDAHLALEAQINKNGLDIPHDLLEAGRHCWDKVCTYAEGAGIRNAQASVLAPTGCVTADTLILSSHGLLPIADLGDVDGRQWQDVTFSVVQEKGAELATKFFVNGEDDVYLIRTEHGHQIRATWKHRLRVVDETGAYVWKRMCDIAEGDLVVTRLGGHEELLAEKPYVALRYAPAGHNKELPVNLPEELDERTAEVLGFYMGNGYTKRDGVRWVVGSGHSTAADTIREWVHGIGRTVTVEERPGCFVVNLFSHRVARWWALNGFEKPDGNNGEGAAGAFIPAAILHSRTSVLAAFLRGLFEADGTVSLQKTGSPTIELTTVSERLAREVHTALEALGIATNLQMQDVRDDQWGSRVKYRLRPASLVYCERFAEQIGFLSETKQRLLREGLAYDAVVTDARCTLRHQALLDELYTVSQGLPNEVRQDILVRKRQGRANLRWLNETVSMHAQLGKSKVAQLLAVGELQFLRVVDARFVGRELTYDLSVPIRNTYVANGFVSHNTIAFLMDCDTTGVEPDIALVKYKRLVGGGILKMVNRCVPTGLRALGYNDAIVDQIVAYIDEHDTIEGCPHLDPEHLPVFDCAFKPAKGTRSIEWRGHVQMMAAVQPFISGAISKTINMPEEATVADIREAYVEAWQLGLKAVAIYRDNSKRTQPLSTKKAGTMAGEAGEADETADEAAVAVPGPPPEPMRNRLPATRLSVTHKFEISGHEGYVSVGMYPNGQPGEIFIKMAKEGSVVSGMIDSFATSMSIGLQFGIPLRLYVKKFRHARFEPHGWTANPQIRQATSVLDYIMRWLDLTFLGGNAGAGSDTTVLPPSIPKATIHPDRIDRAVDVPTETAPAPFSAAHLGDTKPCSLCGNFMIRQGNCYQCFVCGENAGCG